MLICVDQRRVFKLFEEFKAFCGKFVAEEPEFGLLFLRGIAQFYFEAAVEFFFLFFKL